MTNKQPGQITRLSSGKLAGLIVVALFVPILVFACLVDRPSPAREPGWMGIKATKLGCTSRDRARFIESMRGSGDRDAFMKSANAAVLSGDCAIFDEGDEVYLLEGEIFGGMARVRKRGATAGYWIYSSGLN